MNVIDAYSIMEHYAESNANGPRSGESWKRISALKNSKNEILAAFKLFFAHAIFWNDLPGTKVKEYERLVVYQLAMFKDDSLVNEFTEIRRQLKNRNIFTRIRSKEVRTILENKQKELGLQLSPLEEMSKYAGEVDDYIENVLPMMNSLKEKLRTLNNDDFDAQYANLLGNFVCDVYELAHIERHYNDTEYFWPFEQLFKLSNDPQFDYLFSQYKVTISKFYNNNQRDR